MKTAEEYEDKDDFYYDDYDGPLESCPNCGRMYDDIDYDFQSCNKCGWDDVNKKYGERLKPDEWDYMNGAADILTGEWL